ncbi:MAG TPA: hypothetical protein VEL07_02665 [Planctomycetota bacterium]|nr:hypothetical protein [Planctomycetota bacterium]
MVYFTIKTLKKFFKIFNSLAAPWQVFLGTLLGTLIGFLPIWPPAYGPSPLGLILVFLIIVLNCHLGSALLFFGLSWLISKALAGPAVLVGEQFEGLARWASTVPFLHMSLWSHTGYLGLTLIGAACALLFAIVMWRFTIYFRTTLRDRLMANKRLATVGKVGGNTILMRVVCWFFDI